MKRSWLVLVTLGLLLGVVGWAAAQPGDIPLLMHIEGDIWSWDGTEITQLTDWGHNDRPVMAPDGRHFAYNSISSLFVEDGEQFFVGDVMPSNIWVGDLETGEFDRISEQPETGNGAVLRSTPAWSPDGRKLVWSEVSLPNYDYQISVYDLAADTTEIVVSGLPQPFDDAGVHPVPVWWVPGSLVTRIVRFTEFSTEGPDNELWIFDESGTLQHVVNLGAHYVYPLGWTHYAGKDYMGVFNYQNQKIGLVDPVAGTVWYVTGQLEMQSGTNPANRLLVNVQPNSQTDVWDVTVTWQTVDGDMLDINHDLFAQHRIALAPHAQAVAYLTDAVYLWQAGEAEQIPGTSGRVDDLAWGSAFWRVAEDESAGPPVCPGALPTRLSAGMEARVVPNPLPNVVRDKPGTDDSTSTILGNIAGGEVFTVLDGPRCAEGMVWWEVDYQGLVGWTAEGQGDIYWLEPLP